MADTPRATLELPSDLLDEVDTIICEAFVAAALRRELEARRGAEIDAAIAEMANDEELQREELQIEAEFARASWEALQEYEREMQ